MGKRSWTDTREILTSHTNFNSVCIARRLIPSSPNPPKSPHSSLLRYKYPSPSQLSTIASVPSPLPLKTSLSARTSPRIYNARLSHHHYHRPAGHSRSRQMRLAPEPPLSEWPTLLPAEPDCSGDLQEMPCALL
ncbi:hypothetical protein BU26DRAFT_607362, partial [Trematosphaeria pertusa]